MSVSPDDFLDLSKNILIPHASEISLRSATSRAYYCCYHSVLEFIELNKLPDHNGISQNVGSHETIISKLSSMPLTGSSIPDIVKKNAMTIRGLGYMLKQMKVFRANADYTLSSDFSLASCESHILTAEKLLERIKDLNKALVI